MTMQPPTPPGPPPYIPVAINPLETLEARTNQAAYDALTDLLKDEIKVALKQRFAPQLRVWAEAAADTHIQSMLKNAQIVDLEDGLTQRRMLLLEQMRGVAREIFSAMAAQAQAAEKK